jgi:UDP:flavonoid glycosyltransferase YjiC (YdhE family)
VVKELEELLTNGSYQAAATRIAAELAKENGVAAACAALEAALP